jgi:hypothetical protein
MANNRIWLSVVSCAVVAVAATATATEWRPSDDFLMAVREVESSNGKFKVGDSGQSLGDFQLSEAAWLDVNSWRRSRGLKTYHYEQAVFNGFINKVYASNYLTILHGELSRALRRAPSHGELYAAYNMGLTEFAECNYRLTRVNAMTRAKVRQINEFLAARTDS